MDDCISRQAALNPNIKVSGLTIREAEIVKGISKAYMDYLKRLPAANVIPAPPPHGRLIDADALLRMEQADYEGTMGLHPNPWMRTFYEAFHKTFRKTIENAPTVLPEVEG